jgi:hypothetical protein
MKVWGSIVVSKFEKVLYISDLPETIDSKTIYVVGSSERPWCILFLCPCGCGKVTQLNTLYPANPRWEIKKSEKLGENTYSIHPSIVQRYGCHSHFSIIGNEVVWH